MDTIGYLLDKWDGALAMLSEAVEELENGVVEESKYEDSNEYYGREAQGEF